jgi:pantoate--beta-alanine ligase
MRILKTIEEVRDFRKQIGGKTLGFVPTMGYLHEGHIALVRRALPETDHVAVSIYVNPKQFGPAEDLSRYPRDLERDFSLLEPLGVDFVFVPDDKLMYPPDYQTRVVVEEITQHLEGNRRPTHFEGVTTVVAKLFNIIQPTHAYFGQKDAQQSVVIRQMIRDLNFDLDLIICPTIRESDGLAMSSRNKYLAPDQRLAASVLYRSLLAAQGLWEEGTRDGRLLREELLRILKTEPLARIDYVSAADPKTLTERESTIPAGEGILLSMAVFFGNTRLIDNILLTP